MSRKNEIALPQNVDVAKLASYRSQATELVAFLEAAPCNTPETERWFSTQLSNCRALIKEIETERTKITSAILATKRSVDALFKPAVTPLERCEAVIRAKLQGAAQMRLRAEEAVLQLAADAASAGDHKAVLAAVASLPEAPATEGSSSGWRWEANVVDFEALSDDFKMVDEEALVIAGSQAKKLGTEPSARGVVWTKVATLRAKS